MPKGFGELELEELVPEEDLVDTYVPHEKELVSDEDDPIDIYGDRKVKQIIRTIAKDKFTRPDLSAVAVEEIDSYLSLYIEKGFQLFNTHFIGLIPEGYSVLYILVRD